MASTLTNWAGNYQYTAAGVLEPESVEQVAEMVTRHPSVRVLGTRHSFNDIADSAGGQLISLRRMDRVLELNARERTVTVQAGIAYGSLCRELHSRGWAVHNLASLPHISVAGACATATHGSGAGNACLASALVGLKIVSGNGEIISASASTHPDSFHGMVVGLGALGAVVELTLRIEPAFEMTQVVYENLPMDAAVSHFDEIVGGGYSVSLFTDWRERRFNQAWFKRRVDRPAAFEFEPVVFGATRAKDHLHPIAGISAENCTRQMGETGPWHERLPHFRMEFTPSSGEELQSEYLVPREHAIDAMEAIAGLRDQIAPLLLISEVRTIAGDEFWLSPFHQQPRGCVAFHFTWKQDWPRVRELLPRIEAALEPFSARPHWGKLFAMKRDAIERLYPRLGDFRELVHQFDPARKFRNAFLERCAGYE